MPLPCAQSVLEVAVRVVRRAITVGIWESKASGQRRPSVSPPTLHLGCVRPSCRQPLTVDLRTVELGTRVPLIIAAPHLTASHGHATLHLAELVDVCASLFLAVHLVINMKTYLTGVVHC